ncbi:MAG: gliding motility-associated C-terminal domain-containing protein, partial [Lutibacter sp.]|uniref:T9SS type B sorting domain-containing protein n=1 Tax=Lutibacter sp. TaxID=1925666 RepID=UPI00385B6DA7
TPNEGFTGTDSFVYEVCDNGDPIACDQATVVITVNPDKCINFEISITSTEETCEGANGTATVIVDGAKEPVTYLWSDGQTTSTAIGLVEGSYNVTVTDANGCSETTSFNLTSTNNNTTTSEDFTACDSYTWNDVTYTESGVYTFESDNEFGCTNTATLSLTINNSSETAAEDITACDSYTWNGTTYTESGVYTYESDNDSGCTNTATLNLTINNGVLESTFIICDDLFDDNGNPVQTIDLNNYLSIASNNDGEWVSLDTSGRLITGSVFNVIDLENGVYEFEFTSSVSGCISYLSLEKDCIVLPCSTEGSIEISKVVTANNDGVNDFFEISEISSCGFTAEVTIFNRWGKIVYQSNNYQNNWGGYHNNSGLTMGTNNKLPTGTYYYVVNIIGSGYRPITGYIYLGTN